MHVITGMHACISVCVHVHQKRKELSHMELHACLHMRKLPLTKHWPGGASDCAIITESEPEILLNRIAIQPCGTEQSSGNCHGVLQLERGEDVSLFFIQYHPFHPKRK